MNYLKRWIGLLSCLGVFVPLWAQSGYDIAVHVNGFEADAAYLAYYYGDKQYIKDTVAVTEGRFRFQGEEALPGGIYLVVLPPANTYFEMLIDQDQHFSLLTDTADFVQHMRVQGSEENQLFYEDIRFIATKRKEAQALQEKRKNLDPDSEAARQVQAQYEAVDQAVKQHRSSFLAQHPDLLYAKVIQTMEEPPYPQPEGEEAQKEAFYTYRKQYLDNVDFTDARLLRTPVFFNRINRYLEQLTHKQPDSISVAVNEIIERSRPNDDVFQYLVVSLLNKYARSKIMGMDAVYARMVERYYMSGDAFWADSAQVAKLAERALAIMPTLIGRPAPNFRVQDDAGNWRELHGINAKYTILYFWDYDCGHCKKVTPKLGEAYAQYLDKDVALFAVSINGDLGEWKEKFKSYGLDKGINVQDHYRRSGFDAMYDIRSTPRLFLLDKEKKILAKQITVYQMQEILNRELGLPPPPADDEDPTDETETDHSGH